MMCLRKIFKAILISFLYLFFINNSWSQVWKYSDREICFQALNKNNWLNNTASNEAKNVH